MNPTELNPGLEYIFKLEGVSPVVLIYRYETINKFIFDEKGTAKIVLLHYMQVKKNVWKVTEQ